MRLQLILIGLTFILMATLTEAATGVCINQTLTCYDNLTVALQNGVNGVLFILTVPELNESVNVNWSNVTIMSNATPLTILSSNDSATGYILNVTGNNVTLHDFGIRLKRTGATVPIYVHSVANTTIYNMNFSMATDFPLPSSNYLTFDNLSNLKFTLNSVAGPQLTSGGSSSLEVFISITSSNNVEVSYNNITFSKVSSSGGTGEKALVVTGVTNYLQKNNGFSRWPSAAPTTQGVRLTNMINATILFESINMSGLDSQGALILTNVTNFFMNDSFLQSRTIIGASTFSVDSLSSNGFIYRSNVSTSSPTSAISLAGTSSFNFTSINAAASGTTALKITSSATNHNYFINSSLGGAVSITASNTSTFMINTSYGNPSFTGNSSIYNLNQISLNITNSTNGNGLDATVTVSANDTYSHPIFSPMTITVPTTGLSSMFLIPDFRWNATGVFQYSNYSFLGTSAGRPSFTGYGNISNLSYGVNQYNFSFDYNFPTWSNNATNASTNFPHLNDTVQFNVTLSDNVRIYSAWFMWNSTGAYLNTSEYFFSGSIFQVNMTINNTANQKDFGWMVFFNDTAGNLNQTDLSILHVFNYAPNITVNIVPSPAQASNNLTCNYTYYDYDSDSQGQPSYTWFNGTNSTNLSNTGITVQTVGFANLTLGSAWKCNVTISDGFSNLTYHSPVLQVGDTSAPNISGQYYSTTSNDAGTSATQNDLLYLFANCSDTISNIQNVKWWLYTWGDNGATFNQNLTITNPSNGSTYQGLKSLSTVDTWGVRASYCTDSSGNVFSNLTGFNVTVNAIPGSSSSGGGGGGPQPTVCYNPSYCNETATCCLGYSCVSARCVVGNASEFQVCGNNICDASEDSITCPSDCGGVGLNYLTCNNGPNCLFTSSAGWGLKLVAGLGLAGALYLAFASKKKRKIKVR